MKLTESIFISRKRTRRLVVALAFLGSLVAYLLTLEPDASYWDCPEYLVTAARLEIGHPPGNPIWTLTARMFSFLGGSDPQAIAIAVNASSALFTALAVAILASIIFILLSILKFPAIPSDQTGKDLKFPAIPSDQTGKDHKLETGRKRRRLKGNLLRGVCAWGGAMCFGWADSPWFSAVEAEVYALSLFLTALTIRLMIGWAMMPTGPKSRRHLLLIVYLTGLSIGVHQLNLLVLPAIALIWLFRRYPRPTGALRIWTALLAGAAAVGLILLLMMPGVLKVAAGFELFFVNSLNWPYHSGVWIFWGITLLIVWLIPFCVPRRFGRMAVIAWIPAMLLTGYSSYMILLVRSAANPPMNEGAPENIFSLQTYLGRDQYGSAPLFYGRTPYSPILREERIGPDGIPDYSHNALRDGSPHYAPTDSGYVLYEHTRIPVYAPELNMFFPRLTSQDPADIEAYADWAGMTSATMTPVEVSYALDSLGNAVGCLKPDGSRTRETELRPTYMQQLRYLLGYQAGYMYFRYMLWNLSGRQNDRFAVGEVEHGNFITGFPAVDNLMLGPQEAMPEEIGADNPGHNVYFLLPLLIGIAGMIFLNSRGRKGKRANSVILVLFLMTGLAIVFYLNQSPREPRERDYSFLGSLWAYAIWIGAGMALLIGYALRMLRFKSKFRYVPLWCATAFSLALPIWMLAQNYDDHDRSGRRGVTDFAANLLESLEPDAILFTNGDNFTFPLWWAQEVAGIRRDVTIVNTAYLGTPWYIRQLRGDTPGAKGLEMLIPADELALGGFKFNRYSASSPDLSWADSLSAVDAITALRDFYAEDESTRRLPSVVRIPNPEGGDSLLIRSAALASGSSLMNMRRLAAFDIIASNASSAKPRPVYWQSSLSGDDYFGMMPLTTRTLHTRRLVYADTLTPESKNHFLDHDLQKALSSRSGRTPSRAGKRIYADDTFGHQITSQRQSLIRFGNRLMDAGRYDDALQVARLTDSIFPPSIWEYQIFIESDSAIDEGVDLARLYLEGSRRSAGSNSKNSDDYAKSRDYRRGLEILHREYARYMQWRRYRDALPTRLRGVMTPKNRLKVRKAPQVDSLLQRYERN